MPKLITRVLQVYLTPKVLKEAVEIAGSYTKAAETLGVSKTTVADRAKDFEIESPYKRPTIKPINYNRIPVLVAKGETVSEIASELGATRARIDYYVKKHHLYPKTQKQVLAKRWEKSVFYLFDNPSASSRKLMKLGYLYPLLISFGTLNNAKNALRVSKEYVHKAEIDETEMQQLHGYLRRNPKATVRGLPKNLRGILYNGIYKGSIVKAKKALQLPEIYIREKNYKTNSGPPITYADKKLLISRLLANPKLTTELLGSRLRRAADKFYGGLNDAKVKLNLAVFVESKKRGTKRSLLYLGDKKKIDATLRSNPKISTRRLNKLGLFSALELTYGTLNGAKITLNLEPHKRGQPSEAELTELCNYLSENSGITSRKLPANLFSILHRAKLTLNKAKDIVQKPMTLSEKLELLVKRASKTLRPIIVTTDKTLDTNGRVSQEEQELFGVKALESIFDKGAKGTRLQTGRPLKFSDNELEMAERNKETITLTYDPPMNLVIESRYRGPHLGKVIGFDTLNIILYSNETKHWFFRNYCSKSVTL